jgi:outer membrane protein insertion porin family
VTGENGQTLLASALTYRLGIDKRDNRFDPTSGYFAEIQESFSGLGGDVRFLKTELRGAWYKPFYFNQLIVGARGRIGFVDGLGEKVTQSSRFYLGGRNVRGFDGGGIGPIDAGTKTAVGGNQIYSGSLEIVSTLGLNKDTGLRWTAYTDFGSVWGVDFPTGVTGPEDDKMRQSVGVGLLWDTAIGPLSFYWADAVSKASYDKTKRFQFSLGARL